MLLRTLDHTIAATLRSLPALRGKAQLGLAWKDLRERRRPLEGAWDLRLADGSPVSLPRGSRMTWTVASTGDWDVPLIEFVSRYVAPHTLVLDVGASLGLWSLPLGRIARDRSSLLWAFEPDPRNIAWLTANVQRNHLTDVIEVHSCALGSRAGTGRLGHREPGGGNAALRREAVPETVDVRVARLDDLDLPRRVSFMKIDVEGFELEVLRGAQNMIERDRPVIYGEFSAGWLQERGEDVAAHLGSLSARGYDVFAIEARRTAPWRARDGASLRRLDARAAAGTENLLLVPRPLNA